MTKPTGRQLLEIVAAIAVATLTFSVAALASGGLMSVFGATIGAIAVVLIVRRIAVSAPAVGIIAMVAVPVGMLIFGTVIVGVASTERSSTFSTPNWHVTDDGFAARMNERLAAALDRADVLVSGGSHNLLEVSIDERTTSVTVLDPSSGRRSFSSDSSYGWSEPSISSASDRRTFARGDLTSLNLHSAFGTVRTAAAQMKLDATVFDGVKIGPRSEPDNLLVAAFTLARTPIEVNMRGELPDTIDAGSLDGALAAAERLITAQRISLRRPTLGSIDFKSLHENADNVGASSIMISGGVELDFDTGPLSRAVLVPGRFPILSPAPEQFRPSAQTFAFSSVSAQTLGAIRDDLMKRFSAPAYDRDAVGYSIDATPRFNDEVVVQMRVGPYSARTGGFYRLDGTFLAAEAY